MAPREEHSQNILARNVANTASAPTVTVTPADLNRDLLITLFRFKQGAKLKKFLIEKTKEEKTYYSLAEILTLLKDIIRRERLFDERNPSIILCSKQLEEALDQHALHVTEVRDLVLKQVYRLPDQTTRDRVTPQEPQQQGNLPRMHSMPVPGGPPQAEGPRVIRTASIATSIQTNRNARFNLKPLFLKVARSVEGTNPSQTIFTYGEVTLLLSKYILARKETLFDHRNIKLVLVKEDPLGKAFGVTAFHRCQVNALLRSQLIPLHPDSHPDETEVTSTASPGVSLSVEERPVPILPTRGPITSYPTISVWYQEYNYQRD